MPQLWFSEGNDYETAVEGKNGSVCLVESASNGSVDGDKEPWNTKNQGPDSREGDGVRAGGFCSRCESCLDSESVSLRRASEYAFREQKDTGRVR